MHKRLLMATAAVAMSTASVAQGQFSLPPFSPEYAIYYDGMLDIRGGVIYADTLFVVNNGNGDATVTPTGLAGDMQVWVQVIQKDGTLIWEGELWNSVGPLLVFPPQTYGWFSLGMVVGRDTIIPNSPDLNGGEKFMVRIWAAHPNESTFNVVPPVEVKQVVYANPVQGGFEEAKLQIWNTLNYRLWTETSLGGNRHGNGVIWTILGP